MPLLQPLVDPADEGARRSAALTAPTTAPASPLPAPRAARAPLPPRARRLRAAMARMRSAPRPWDPCWLAARANLAVLRDLAARATALAAPGPPAIVDVGCGSKPFRAAFPAESRYLGLDLDPGSSADLLHDLERPLPVPDASAHGVVLSEVLEHVREPYALLAEVARVLVPGGLAFVSTPFSFPVHGRPDDFHRFTEYFYRALPERFPLALERLEATNVVLTTPLLHLEQILLSAPALPFALKQAGWLAANLLAAPLEAVCRRRWRGETRLALFLRSNPAGYAAILRRRA